MKAIEFPEQTVVYAEEQEEYFNLPAFKNKYGIVISCWYMGLWERVKILFTGRIFLSVHTFNSPLQPLRMTTKFEEFSG